MGGEGHLASLIVNCQLSVFVSLLFSFTQKKNCVLN